MPEAHEVESLGAPLLPGSDGGDERAQGATLPQTALTILNIFVGTGLLTMPYALMRGGWAALGVQALLLPMFALSGQLMCSAFELLPAHTPRTYPELGRAAGGGAGLRAVLLCSFLELFGGSCLLMLVAWQQLVTLLPAQGLGPLLSPVHWAAALATLLLLPLLWIDLRRLSRLSVVGLASSGSVVALVAALPLLDPRREGMPQQPPPGHHLLSPGIVQAVGVFSLSATAHSTLPALRTAMREPARFPVALGASFCFMLAAYSLLAAAGYFYFGDAASPLVTADLAGNSWYTTHSRVPVHRMLAGAVLVNALTKYPGLNLCLQDMLLSLGRDDRGSYRRPRRWAVGALRLALLAAGSMLSLAAYEALGSTLSLLGGLASITCSLLLPTAFYARLAWPALGCAPRCGLLALLALGTLLVSSITATNLCDMSARCHAWRQPAAATTLMRAPTHRHL